MNIFKLWDGQQVCFYYDGNMTFCTCATSFAEKKFSFCKSLESCEFYFDGHYVGRIICQGYRIYDENDKMILEEGKCEK